jgi:TolB protein
MNSPKGNGMKKFLALISLLCVAASSASAQTDLYVRGAGRLIPIALPQLCNQGEEGDPATEIPSVMRRDLDISGYFEILDPKGYIESAGKCGAPEATAFSDWSAIGSEGLVKGKVSLQGGRVIAQLYLLDVQKQQVVLAKEYQGDAAQSRMIAHRFANDILKYYTGFPGVFGTEIGFSGRIGRFKELMVMDMDGSNIRQLTNDRGLSMSPSWDPSGSRLVFTGFRNRIPDLFMMNVGSKSVRQVTRTTELEIGAHFLGNDRLLVSRTEGSDSDIVIMSTDGTIERRLTSPNRAIDVSPVPSPDGRQVVFCSDRSGNPQIYTMGIDGSNQKRISFVASNFCTSPAWSPTGDKIAFVCRADGKFQIFVSDVTGENALQLTSAGTNEDPDFSPDGRYVTFASTYFGGPYSIAIMRIDGTSIKQITKSRAGDHEPTWGPLPE